MSRLTRLYQPLYFYSTKCVGSLLSSSSSSFHTSSTHGNKAKQRDGFDSTRHKSLSKEKSDRGLRDPMWDVEPQVEDHAEKRDDGGIDIFHGALRIPGPDTDNALFNGIKFCELPVVNVYAGWNNTILTVSNGNYDGNHRVMLRHSCGMEGFKNAKKSTNVASQTTAITLAQKCLKKGMKTVRVMVNGIGPGRLATVKGLQMGGLDIVAIQDATPFRTGNRPPRPRSV